MAREIAETPALLRRGAPRWAEQAAAIHSSLERRPELALVGRGSSGNACTYAAYVHALRTGRHPIEFRPWVCTQHVPESSWERVTVHAYSASGESTDVAHAAGWLASRGAQIVGITNAEERRCRLEGASAAVLRLRVGQERAVPATKSFCAQLFAAAALSGLPVSDVAPRAADSQEALLDRAVARELATFLDGARTVVWIARGPCLAVALDAALKLQEAARIPSAAYSTAEYLHGPIASMSPRDRVVILADAPQPLDSIQAVRAKLLTLGAPFVVAGRTTSEATQIAIPLPDARWAAAVVLATLTQLVALELAERRGLDPDSPTGLQKVTLT